MDAISSLNSHIEELSYEFDRLKAQSTQEESLDLLDRTLTIANISILYRDELSDNELFAVSKLVELASSYFSSNKTHKSDTQDSLKSIIEGLENVFRSKHLLLDSTKKI